LPHPVRITIQHGDRELVVNPRGGKVFVTIRGGGEETIALPPEEALLLARAIEMMVEAIISMDYTVGARARGRGQGQEQPPPPMVTEKEPTGSG